MHKPYFSIAEVEYLTGISQPNIRGHYVKSGQLVPSRPGVKNEFTAASVLDLAVKRAGEEIVKSRLAQLACRRNAVKEAQRPSGWDDLRRRFLMFGGVGHGGSHHLFKPTWADMQKVLEFYEHSQLLRDMGHAVVVEFIVPKKSPYVCGLMVFNNLRITDKNVNRRKGRSYDPDTAPHHLAPEGTGHGS